MDYFALFLEGICLLGQGVMHILFVGRLIGKKQKLWYFSLHSPPDRAPACLGQAFPQRDTLHCRRCVGTVCCQPFWDGESTVRVLAGRRAGLLRLPALLWQC